MTSDPPPPHVPPAPHLPHSPQRPTDHGGRWTLWSRCLAAAATCICLMAVALAALLPSTHVTASAMCVFSLSIAAAIVAFTFVALESHPRQRRAWRCIALGLLCHAAGDLLRALTPALPSALAEPLLLAARCLSALLLTLGLVSFRALLRSSADRLKFALDAAVLLVGCVLLVAYHVANVSDAPASLILGLDLANALLPPALELLALLAAVAVIARRSAGGTRLGSMLFCAGLLTQLLSSVLGASAAISGQRTAPSGEMPTLAVGVLLLLLGILAEHNAHGATTWRLRARNTEPARLSLLPYVSVTAAFALVLHAQA
jgi:hypothetical protein